MSSRQAVLAGARVAGAARAAMVVWAAQAAQEAQVDMVEREPEVQVAGTLPAVPVSVVETERTRVLVERAARVRMAERVRPAATDSEDCPMELPALGALVGVVVQAKGKEVWESAEEAREGMAAVVAPELGGTAAMGPTVPAQHWVVTMGRMGLQDKMRRIPGSMQPLVWLPILWFWLAALGVVGVVAAAVDKVVVAVRVVAAVVVVAVGAVEVRVLRESVAAVVLAVLVAVVVGVVVRVAAVVRAEETPVRAWALTARKERITRELVEMVRTLWATAHGATTTGAKGVQERLLDRLAHLVVREAAVAWVVLAA